MNYNNTTNIGTSGRDSLKGRRMLRYTAPTIKCMRAATAHDVLYVTSNISGRGISEQEEDMGFVSPKASEQEKVASFGPLIEEKNKIWQ